MDTAVPLLALLAKVDAILTAQGTDPADITNCDKIMIAVQYVEVASIQGIMDQPVREAFRL